MFGRIAKSEKSNLDTPIERVLEEMEMNGPDTEEYPELLGYLERLNKMKTEPRPEPISLDTIVMVAGGILQVLIIVSYEHLHVITSKGLNFILKSKSSATSLPM